jgi:hypothetical protein
MAMLAGTNAMTGDPLSGASLYDDVRRYDSFGQHRYGSLGAEKAFDWISGELNRAGLAVSSQPFTMGRQYDFDQGSLSINGKAITVMPQWWLPESLASFTLSAPIVATGDAPGAFVRLTIPYDRGAYLTQGHRTALEGAFARHPVGVFLTIEHPSGEIFTYNVDQEQRPWPVPVILVAPKDKTALDGAEAMGRPVTLTIKGSYRRDVSGRNVIGRADRGKGRAIVISTPVTSWFTSTCERAPGIAAFLAMGRIAHDRLGGADLVFVATAGHEIGHGGMEHFIRDEAPRPDVVAAWVHFGSSLACYAWQRNAAGSWVTDRVIDTGSRFINRTQSLDELVRRHFREVRGIDRIGKEAGVGELQDVHAAGYQHFFGINGRHAFFHTAADTAAATGPEALEPVVRAFAGALMEVSGRE